MSEFKETNLLQTINTQLSEPLVKQKPKKTRKQIRLEKDIDRLRTQPHPLQKSGLIGSLFYLWVGPFLSIGNRTSIQQNMMPTVPKRDRVEANEGNIKAAFALKGGIGRAIIHLHFWTFFKAAFLMGLAQACFCSLALVLYFLIEDVATSHTEGWDEQKKKNSFFLWYGILTGTQFFGAVFINYVTMDLSRLGVRLKNTLIFAVFKKTLGISVLNPGLHTEGKIVNYVQVFLVDEGGLPEGGGRDLKVQSDPGVDLAGGAGLRDLHLLDRVQRGADGGGLPGADLLHALPL